MKRFDNWQAAWDNLVAEVAPEEGTPYGYNTAQATFMDAALGRGPVLLYDTEGGDALPSVAAFDEVQKFDKGEGTYDKLCKASNGVYAELSGDIGMGGCWYGFIKA